MLYIGCHLSSSKGFAAMGRQALELGANTFQFFTRNPRAAGPRTWTRRTLQPCGTCWPGTASAPSSPTLPIL